VAFLCFLIKIANKYLIEKLNNEEKKADSFIVVIIDY
jgi:hypothetical protein